MNYSSLLPLAMDAKVKARGYRSVVEDLQCSEFESQYSKTNKQKKYVFLKLRLLL